MCQIITTKFAVYKQTFIQIFMMKRILFVLTILTCIFSISFAESPCQPEETKHTDDTRSVVLFLKQDPSRHHRSPAKPLVGTYDGTTLVIDIYACEGDEGVTLCIHTADSCEEYKVTVQELSFGIDIPLPETSWIEIVTSQATYIQQ